MQSNQLFINGIELELSDATRIGVTFQANNLGELQYRQGTFTNQFKVPLSLKNKQTLEHINLMTSASVIPYRRNTATYIEGGIEIVYDGEAIIKKTDLEFAYIDIIGGNMDVSRAIGDVRVGDLYIPDGYLSWDNQTMIDSNDKSKYYIFPFIDWRVDSDAFFSGTTIDPKYVLPACYIPQMITRLEAYTGFKFKGTHIDSDNHLNMVLTPDELTLDPQSVSDLIIGARVLEQYGNPITPALANYPLNIPEGSGYVEQNYPINWAINSDMQGNDNFGFNQGVYYPPVNNTGQLKFIGTLGAREEYINGGLGLLEFPKEVDYYFVAQIKWSNLAGTLGGVLAEQTSDVVSGKLNSNSDIANFYEQVIDITTNEMVFEVGRYYYCEVIFHAKRHSNADAQITFYIEDSMPYNFQLIPTNKLVYSNQVRFQDIFRMKVSDVLKDILNKYGIIIQTNSYKKEVYLNYFSDLIKNKSTALDWSDKIDIRNQELSFKFGKYGKQNNIKFKPDENVPSGLGDFSFDIDDETLEDVVDAVKLNHSATVETNRYNGFNIPTIEGVDYLYNWNKPTYRILQLRCQNTSFNVTYNDGSTAPTSNTSIPFCNFQGMDELAPVYYETLIDILRKSKVIVLNTKLSSTDISSLDFTIPIFLNIPELSINGYFYVNKISNYKKGSLTQVEYIRL